MKYLVYTMGKVGSTTVMRALESVGIAAGRGYPGNIHSMNLDEYDGFITMVRDPIARNISQFFETKSELIRSTSDPMNLFLKLFPHFEPAEWFEQAIKPILGINAYAGTFPKTKGWKVYRKKLLVIQTERLSDSLADALCKFIVPHDYVVEHRAIGLQKFHPAIGERYERFLENAKFSADFLNTIYDTKYAKHFYSQKDIEAFKERWVK